MQTNFWETRRLSKRTEAVVVYLFSTKLSSAPQRKNRNLTNLLVQLEELIMGEFDFYVLVLVERERRDGEEMREDAKS